MKIRIAALLVPVLLALCVGSAAAKKAPPKSGVDTNFGKQGKALVAVPKSEGTEQLKTATGPYGETYVLDEGLLLSFTEAGKPNLQFGKNGRERITAAAGETTEVTGLAVDAKGRVLVSGSVDPTPGVPASVIPPTGFVLHPVAPSTAFVDRLLPDGDLDPTFGGAGEIDVTVAPPPRSLEETPPNSFGNPVVYGDRLAVVNGETPVLGGTYASYVTYCRNYALYTSSFVGAIDPAGSSSQRLAPTAYTELPQSTVTSFAPMPGGNLAALSDPSKGCGGDGYGSTTLSALNTGGAPAPALDPARPTLDLASLAVDAHGRFLGVAVPNESESQATPKKLVRLLPNGAYDTSFAGNGGLPLKKFGERSVRGLVVDSKGRPTVGGTGNGGFLIGRFGTKGKVDRSFADHGWLEAGFGTGTSAELEAMTTDAKGRILAVGRVTGKALKTGVGVGLIRILPGN